MNDLIHAQYLAQLKRGELLDKLRKAEKVITAARKMRFDYMSFWAKYDEGMKIVEELNAALAAYDTPPSAEGADE